MKISDVVNRVREVLPEHTDLFGDILSISSITATGGIATITTSAAHNISTGDAVTVANVATRTPIDSVLNDGLLFTFTTSLDHDLTFGWPEHGNIELGGFTDGDWNNSFKLISSNNRREFIINSVNSNPTLNGNEYLLEYNRFDGVDGVYSATVTGVNTFTVSGDFSDGVYTPINGAIYTNPRVASTIDIDRAIEEYTKNDIQDYWIFVEPVNVEISKDRSTMSDANNSIANGNEMRTRMIDGFTLYIIAPTSNQIAGEVALDVCRHDLLLPLMKTLYGYQFDTGTSNPMDFRATLNSHGVRAYDRAYMVYAYEFEVVIDLTNDDAVNPRDTRAFRDIDYNLKTQNPDADIMDVHIDLDINPI